MSIKGGYPFAGNKNPGVFVVQGGFVCNGGSAPTVVVGAGFTVSAPAATGIYTITLTDGAVPDQIAIIPTISDNAANATSVVRVGVITVATNGKFTLRTQSTNGTDANLTGQLVSFVAFLRRTSATR
jgi:hypothetical protein